MVSYHVFAKLAMCTMDDSGGQPTNQPVTMHLKYSNDHMFTEYQTAIFFFQDGRRCTLITSWSLELGGKFPLRSANYGVTYPSYQGMLH